MVDFKVGYNLTEFENYYKTIWKSIPNREIPNLSNFEHELIIDNPSHLIVWIEGKKIIGNAIWHETYTDKHREDLPRENDDREILEDLVGKCKECIELHEIWLNTKYRGNGYGKQFFSFFENFIQNNSFEDIIYYTDNKAAIHICRQRGYKESYGVKSGGYMWYVFALNFSQDMK